MCFSATASFAVAGCTGVVGAFTLRRVRLRSELPLALVPAIFAVQQAIEGALWLTLERGGGADIVVVLATVFAVFALVLWPVVAALAPLLLEAQKLRRRLLQLALGLSIALAVYFLVVIAGHPYAAAIAGHSLQYDNGILYPDLPRYAYALATVAPLLVSSQRALQLFGLVVAVGLAVSLTLFYAALFSVWCFFAAAGSVVVFAHFAALRAPLRGRPA